jgi:hypothetical protein
MTGNKLNIHAAPYFAAAGRVEVLLRCLHNNRITALTAATVSHRVSFFTR